MNLGTTGVWKSFVYDNLTLVIGVAKIMRNKSESWLGLKETQKDALCCLCYIASCISDLEAATGGVCKKAKVLTQVFYFENCETLRTLILKNNCERLLLQIPQSLPVGLTLSKMSGCKLSYFKYHNTRLQLNSR